MEFNQETIKKLRGLILFTVVVLVAGLNYQKLLDGAGTLLKMIFPFLLGGAIAFILNVPMRRIERLLWGNRESKLKRPLSMVISIITVAGILLVVILVVVPELRNAFEIIRDNLPVFLNQVQDLAEDIFSQNSQILELINHMEFNWEKTIENVISFLTTGAGTVLTTTFSAAIVIFNGFTTFGIGFIFAIYILLQKENLSRQMTKLAYAFLPKPAAEKLLEISVLSEKTFSNFLTGQCMEAVILGMMFFITLSLFQMPYAVLIGVLIAFTALIPIFGAFIGCAVGIFLMLIISPANAVAFTVIFFVLQQIEGNLIYPYVVGNSVGLPSIWVLVAVTIGGSAMGIVGMLIFIPLCSVFYAILRELVNKRLTQKNIHVKPIQANPSTSPIPQLQAGRSSRGNQGNQRKKAGKKRR